MKENEIAQFDVFLNSRIVIPKFVSEMTVILKNKESIKKVNETLKAEQVSIRPNRFEKYVGKLKLKESPSDIQRKLRNEWE